MPCVSVSAVTCCTVMCVLLYYEQINGDDLMEFTEGFSFWESL